MSDRSPAKLVPELTVNNLETSLRFWRDLLGFVVRYSRPEEGFAFLDLDGAEIMLDQRGSGPPERRHIWETGPMEYPFGRGINFEIQCYDFALVLDRLRAADIEPYFGPEERWYRVDDREVGVRQVLVQDPDGYLVRLQKDIGERALA